MCATFLCLNHSLCFILLACEIKPENWTQQGRGFTVFKFKSLLMRKKGRFTWLQRDFPVTEFWLKFWEKEAAVIYVWETFTGVFLNGRFPLHFGPVPFLIFTPWPLVLSHKWWNFPPTKWDAPSGTCDVISSLYFSRRCVASSAVVV